MSTDPQELEAARFLRAALDLIGNALPVASAAHSQYVVDRSEAQALVERLEQDAPPWEPERPETNLPWADVISGDQVKAPNGQWYEVAAWSRTGEQVAVMLKVRTYTVKTERKAADKVPVRRGPAGQAADMFRAAGFDLEQVTA